MEMQKVRTDEVVRLASAQFNQKTDERHYINEVHFSFHNHPAIMQAFETGRAVDLGDLPKRSGKSALIVGSGASLNRALPMLKDWEGDIVCSTSHASTIKAFGREPDHILALDPDCNYPELEADTWENTKSVLHAHPGITPDLINWWPGRLALFRKFQPQTAFFGNEQAIGYSRLGPFRDGRYVGNESPPLIKTMVPMLANVLPAEICIAKTLGYRQLAMVGCDFGWKDENHRFTKHSWEDGKWVEHKPAPTTEKDYSIETCTDPVVQTEIDGLMSTRMQIFYAHQTVIAWRITEMNIVNTSEGGLLTMFPHVPLEEVIARGNKGVKGFNVKEIRDASEEHLARQNIYIIVFSKDVAFVNVDGRQFALLNGLMMQEVKDPLFEVPRMIRSFGAAAKQSNALDKFDEDANMRRVKRLFKKVLEVKDAGPEHSSNA